MSLQNCFPMFRVAKRLLGESAEEKDEKRRNTEKIKWSNKTEVFGALWPCVPPRSAPPRYLRWRHNAEGVHDPIGVLLPDLADQQGAHARAGAPSQRVGQLETLKAEFQRISFYSTQRWETWHFRFSLCSQVCIYVFVWFCRSDVVLQASWGHVGPRRMSQWSLDKAKAICPQIKARGDMDIEACPK